VKFGSLFCGIGGFDLGLERAGMQCAWQVEIDEYATRVLEKHWPHVRRWADIQTFPPDDGSDWNVDLICGGPPCQPVSQAGHRKGKSDERWMWGECLRVVATLKPRVFVAENPTMLLRDDKGRTFGGIIRALAALGYVVEWHVINASSVGAPHRRGRVYIVAYSDEQRREGGDKGESLQGVEEAWDESSGSSPACGSRRQAMAGPSGHDGCVRRKRKANQHLQGLPRAARLDWPAEPDVGRTSHGVPARVDRLRCLGNAVVPQVVELIGRAIMDRESQTAARPREG
jgi:DNA (cytosine-5)-methyltransferase 1